MSTKSQDKSARKPRQRSRKADQRSQKPDQLQNAKLDQRDEDQITAMAASADGPTNRAAAPEEFPSSGASLADVPLIGEVAPAEAPSIVAVASADDHPVSIQTIADAYQDYAKRSFQETGSFVEKLAGVRSFDKAIEVQAEFARQAFTSFVLESQKICELYNELAKQIFWPRESFAARMT
jgi:plasmid stabilization system protein ParE